MSRRPSSSQDSAEETAPFLGDPEAPPAPVRHKEARATAAAAAALGSVPQLKSKPLLWLHLLLLLANAAWSLVNFALAPTSHGSPKSASSAGRPRGGIYEATGAPMSLVNSTWNLPIGTRSPFTDLDPAVADAAWATVNMGGKQGWLKVPQAKVHLMNQSSIEFADGSGYLFGLDVFHQLHCLDFLRKKTVLYHPLYPEVEEDQDIPVAYHIAHCIDSIRLSLQCHADLTLIPQRWADGWIEPWAVWTNHHQCRDFDSVALWARHHFPNLRDTLVHPELGVFASGHLNHSALPIWQEPHDDLPDF